MVAKYRNYVYYHSTLITSKGWPYAHKDLTKQHVVAKRFEGLSERSKYWLPRFILEKKP